MADSANVVCGHCEAIVRVPLARLTQAPLCPSCRARIFDGKPIALSESTFDRHIGRNTLPVVVDFWAAWCGPCRAMAPFFEQVSGQLSTTLRFAKLDTDAAQSIAGRFNLRSIPTLILFHEGRELARQSGALDASQLTRWLNATLDSQLGRQGRATGTI